MNPLDTNVVPCKRLDYKNVGCTLWHLNMVFGPKNIARRRIKQQSRLTNRKCASGTVPPLPLAAIIQASVLFFFSFCLFFLSAIPSKVVLARRLHHERPAPRRLEVIDNCAAISPPSAEANANRSKDLKGNEVSALFLGGERTATTTARSK